MYIVSALVHYKLTFLNYLVLQGQGYLNFNYICVILCINKTSQSYSTDKSEITHTNAVQLYKAIHNSLTHFAKSVHFNGRKDFNM